MRPITALAPFLLAAVFAGPAFADDIGISISGTGEVTAAPDTAFVSSGVTTQATTAREALDANSAAMAELLDTLEAAGIAARDIQTSGFSVSPNYVYSDARDDSGYQLPPRIVGYQVSNMVTVRVRELDSLGSVLDQAVTVGANTISGVTFTVADPSDLYDAARRAAFADARSKAELYADVAGERLGDLVSITETQSYEAPQPFMMKARDSAVAQSVPVATGELSFQINVQVGWSFDD